MKYKKTNRVEQIEVYLMGSYKETIERTLYRSIFTNAIYCKYKNVYHRVSITPRNQYFINTRITD